MIDVHQETYTINGEPCRCVANFRDNNVRIMARNFNKQFNMDEYTNFTGNMRDFATTKLNEVNR